MSFTRVDQFLAVLSPGDAIGNEALLFQELLRARGHESEIYAGVLAPEMVGLGLPITACPKSPADGTAAIFHFAIGSPVVQTVLARSEPLILRYHNITPHHFFLGFNPDLVPRTYHAARELAMFAPRAALGLAVSEFNRRDLENAGVERSEVLPLGMDLGRLDSPADPVVRARFEDGRKNLIFVGRVVPNKKIDDLIRAFCAYQRYVEPESRLFLVGDGSGFENYRRRLEELVSHMRIDEVVFTGAVTQSELNAYYRLSDAFLCLSEHEGYGAPLVEAMYVGLPVIAYDAGAVKETLQGGGILLGEKKPEEIAELLGLVVAPGPARDAVLKTQAKALEKIRSVDTGARLEQCLNAVRKTA